jgi:hypothetical protein
LKHCWKRQRGTPTLLSKSSSLPIPIPFLHP